MVTENLIQRASQALCYETQLDVVVRLVSEGVSKEDAYFAMMAGSVKNTLDDQDSKESK
jgi:hypothetical protein